MKSVIVIGEGIAGHAVLFSLAQRARVDRFGPVTLVASDATAPATSLRSTAVAALRGTQRGFSPLGDELVQQWEFAHELLTREKFAGAELVTHQTWCYSPQTHKRFQHLPSATPALAARSSPEYVAAEPAWVLSPQRFLNSIRQRCGELELRAVDSTVTQLARVGEEWRVKLLTGDELVGDRVILASGFWLHWMREWLEGSPLAGLYPVQGSYYQWEDTDLGGDSFSLSLEGPNLIYSHPERRLILGASSVKHSVSFVPDSAQLAELCRDVAEKLALALPPTSAAQVLTGIRAQTKQRRPWAGALAPGLSAIGGLYKNGWVSAWQLADGLVRSL